MWAWIYGHHKPLKKESFEFYDSNFEINNLNVLNVTDLRFDGFYYCTVPVKYLNGQSINYYKFFKNGYALPGAVSDFSNISKLGSNINEKEDFSYGFFKFIDSNKISLEVKERDLPKFSSKFIFLVKKNELKEIHSIGDTIIYKFYYEPLASPYPMEEKK